MATKKELTEKEKMFLEALADDEIKGDIRKAMNRAGYSRGTSPASLVKRLSDEILDLSLRVLEGGAVKASFQLADAMEDARSPDMNLRLRAVEQLLDRVGRIKKDDTFAVGGQQATVFVLPAKE